MSRFSLFAAVYLLLVRNDEVLLLRRKNTGWSDGDYDLIAGHIDGSETLMDALLRESKEEIGITFHPEDARFTHVAHFIGEKEYLYIAFEVKRWEGEPRILEPEKHDDLGWYKLSDLPPNITSGTRAVLDAYRSGSHYSEIEDA